MESESVTRSIQMLRAVLDGETYQAVAIASGLTRSAVEQRVKSVVRDLQSIVGVEGVDEDEAPTAVGMRARRDNYLEALNHYCPHLRGSAPKRARPFTREDMERAVAMTRQRSRCRNRDLALLLVLFSTGARPLEIARLEVRDYLAKDGSVREESMLPAQAAINGKERPLFFVSPKVIAAVDAYLEERARRGHRTLTSTNYRGLDPTSRLFLTGDGQTMPIRVRTIGNRRQFRCGVILDIYRRIFAKAGLRRVSTLCARRTVAEKLTKQGCDVHQVGSMLGVTDPGSVRNLIQRERPSKRSLKAVARELV